MMSNPEEVLTVGRYLLKSYKQKKFKKCSIFDI